MYLHTTLGFIIKNHILESKVGAGPLIFNVFNSIFEMQKLSYLITIRGIKRMMNDILSDQRQIVLQDLCKNFIPCFLEKFNDVLPKTLLVPFLEEYRSMNLKL